MPFVTVSDGKHLYYEEIGTGEPLLLISGMGFDHTLWNDVRDDFANKYRVIVYDNRGLGRSDGPGAQPASIRVFAHDAVALLDQLDIARAHIYGHSMGGMIAQWLAIEHKKRVGALILGATTPGNVHGVPRAAAVDALFVHRPVDLQQTRAIFSDLGLSPNWITEHLEFVKMLLQVIQNAPRDIFKFQYQAIQEHDTWDLLAIISAPTLVLHGREDLIIPTANASLLAEHIPGAQLSLVNSKRHGYFVDAREESSRIVNEFLAYHPL